MWSRNGRGRSLQSLDHMPASERMQPPLQSQVSLLIYSISEGLLLGPLATSDLSLSEMIASALESLYGNLLIRKKFLQVSRYEEARMKKDI